MHDYTVHVHAAIATQICTPHRCYTRVPSHRHHTARHRCIMHCARALAVHVACSMCARCTRAACTARHLQSMHRTDFMDRGCTQVERLEAPARESVWVQYHHLHTNMNAREFGQNDMSVPVSHCVITVTQCNLLVAPGARSCISMRTQPTTATGAPS